MQQSESRVAVQSRSSVDSTSASPPDSDSHSTALERTKSAIRIAVQEYRLQYLRAHQQPQS